MLRLNDDKTGAPDDLGLLFDMIDELDAGVVSSLISNDSCLVKDFSGLLLVFKTSIGLSLWSKITREEKLFNVFIEFLFPEFFIGFKIVSLRTLDKSDLTSVTSLDIDSFIVVKLITSSFLKDFNIIWNELAWSFDNKAFSRQVLFSLRILVEVNSSD